MPGDGLKSVPIVTFFNDPYLFNGWTDLVHFWYAYVKLDADSEFYIFKFLSLFVCLLRGVTRSVPCQALMSYKTTRVSNVLLVMVAVYFRCSFFLYFTVNIMILREIYTSSSKHIIISIFGEIGQ